MARQFTAYLRTKRTKTVVMVMLLVSALGVPMATPEGASAAGCLDTARTQATSLINGQWTEWYVRTTTSSCADLNVKVTNHPANCWVYVDAMYYSQSQGRWIDGAKDDFWMLPGYWRQPLTSVADGTRIAWRFYPECFDPSATLWPAY